MNANSATSGIKNFHQHAHHYIKNNSDKVDDEEEIEAICECASQHVHFS